MSQPDHGESQSLRTIAYAVGITFLSIAALYNGTRLCCCLSDRGTFSRNYSRHLGGSNDPPDIRPSGEQPRMWDVSTAPRSPSRSELGSQSERPGLGQGQGEDEKHDVSCAADDEKRPGWTEFLVSCACSLHQSLSVPFRLGCSCLFSRVSSHYPQTRCQTQMLPFIHPRRTVIILSSPHRRPKSKSVPSSSCLPLSALESHRTQPPTKSMTHQGNMCLGRLASHTPKTTNLPLEAPVWYARVASDFTRVCPSGSTVPTFHRFYL